MTRSLLVALFAAGCSAAGEADDNPRGPVAEPLPGPAPSASFAPPPTPPSTTVSASAAPAASARAAPAPFDATKLVCGRSTCEAGREACCETLDDGGRNKIDRCVKSSAPAEGLSNPGAVFFANCKEKNEAPHYTVVTRCDASEHCGAGRMCCESVNDTFFYRRCLSFSDAMAKTGRGPCPGYEACREGGLCLTPGSTCIEGRCIKAPKAPDNVCDTAADCLVGQRCLHPRYGKPVCTAFPKDYGEPCEKDEACTAFCTDSKGRCRRARSAEKSASLESGTCECP